MAWRGGRAVLAFAIRYRLLPTGRARTLAAFAEVPPRLSSHPDRRATSSHSPKPRGATMTKRRVEIDRNPFIPSFDRTAMAGEYFLIALVPLAAIIAVLVALAGAA